MPFGVDASMGTMKACIDSMMRSDVDRSIVEMTHAVAILEMNRDGLVELLDIHVLSVSCVDPWSVVISKDHVYFMPRDCDCYFRISREGCVEIMDSASNANCRFIGIGVLADSGCVYFDMYEDNEFVIITKELVADMLRSDIPGDRRCMKVGILGSDGSVEIMTPNEAKPGIVIASDGRVHLACDV